MSIGGPSSLGTLLIQRLDAVLGIHASQQSNLANGARPDAVSQTRQADRPHSPANPHTRPTRQAVDHAQAQQQTIRSRQAAVSTQLTSAAATAKTSPPSAPTTLGRTAQLIISLLERYPGAAPALQGKQALWPHPPSAAISPKQPDARGQAPSSGPNFSSAQSEPSINEEPLRPTLPRTPLPASSPLPPSTPSALPTDKTNQASPSTLSTFISQALQQTVQSSGLFYESHLAQFTGNQAQLHELRQEPQNQTHATTPSTEPSDKPNAPEARLFQADALALLVRQQLESLGTQSFFWSGQAWPESKMDWHVQKHPQHDPSAAPEHWNSLLTLHLPVLGTIEIKIQLNQQQLLIDIHSPDQASFLDAHSTDLRQRLQNLDTSLTQLTIQGPDTESATHDLIP